jgi:hypothetical protein
MQRALAVILVCLGLVSPASARALRTTGNEVFCANANDLMDFAAAVSTRNEGNEGAVPGCMKLRRGLRYRVLSDEPDQPTKIRVERGLGRGTVEGYTISVGE